MNLWQHQTDARHEANAMLNSKRNPLIVMPTGTGKTRTAVAITADRIKLGRKVFAITPQKEILSQWIEAYSKAGINYGYINDEGFRGRNKDVYVCMDKSLANMMHRIPEIKNLEIITDEAHHSAANTYESIYNYFSDAPRLGLTATPYRYDNKPLGEYYNKIISTIDMQTAIDKGYLAKPLVIVPEEYKMHVPVKGRDFDPVAQAELLGESRIIGDMIEKYSLIFQGLPVLVACCTFEHAKYVTEQFREAGWRFDHIHSNLPDTERSRMIREIRNEKLNGICTVGIGTEGLDIPGLYGLIWMRKTMSLSIYLQFTGRVLRAYPGKEYGIILDGVGNTVIHGMPQIPRQWSLKTDYVPPEESECGPRTKVCPACGTSNAFDNIFCHICRGEFGKMDGKKRKLPIMVDGKLVVLEDEDMKHEISKKLNEQRKNNFAQMESEKEEKPPVELTRLDKVAIMRKDLMSGDVGTMFREAANQWL